jgi:hypothetical protein
MKSRTRVSSGTLVLVCVSLLAIAAHAQYRGSLQGTVTDAQGCGRFSSFVGEPDFRADLVISCRISC